MAYFIVIGADNDVKNVVDEMKNAHLQHNVITSGCVVEEGGNLYYQWDVYNNNGKKTSESDEPIVLCDALTNQISHFKTLVPKDVIPNVFIISQCLNERHVNNLQLVCKELGKVGGAKLSGLQVDIVLIGYDINKSDDVTNRPHWKLLEALRGIETSNSFHTNILYINNIDYNGAATCVDSTLLAKFLCYWSKIVCSGGCNPKATIKSSVYSIGISEHQYDFRDLNDFFKLSAERHLLDRKLNNNPSAETQKLLDYNYYKKIDLNLQWIDGLCQIESLWKSYCTACWDPSRPLIDNAYSVSRHELELTSYLNSFLKLYIAEEKREIENLNEEIQIKKIAIDAITVSEVAIASDPVQILAAETQKKELQDEIDECKKKIKIHEENIDKNSFIDADEFSVEYGKSERITEEDEEIYNSKYEEVDDLIKYVKSDEGIKTMREAIGRAITGDPLPLACHPNAASNIGRLTPLDIPSESISSEESNSEQNIEAQTEKSGCLFWFKNIFNKKRDEDDASLTINSPIATITDQDRENLETALNRSVNALKRVEDIREWWSILTETISKDKNRSEECKLLMDGERTLYGGYITGKEGYIPKQHTKSISLIDVDKVRKFRDTNEYYKNTIDKFLDRWFDAKIEEKERMTMPELIKHQVLDSFVGRFHTLKWDGNNPFVNENITDEKMHEYIEHNINQSIPFVEYVRIQQQNLDSGVDIKFFSNNKNIPSNSVEFREKYKLGNNSITPVYLEDFVNSLCVVQILDISSHVDAVKDFKPKRETELHRFQVDLRADMHQIIGDANGTVEKAYAIYEWICKNIAYDTSKQIHDAETCWKTRRGVCQAYSELFCHMAEAVGLTAEIVVGKTKNANNEMSEDKHAWVFVYTNEYDGIFIDPTWGAGSINGSRFVRNDDISTWFNVLPYWMIFSHFPDEKYWTKLDIQVSEDEFQRLPYLYPSIESDGKDYLFEQMLKLR